MKTTNANLRLLAFGLLLGTTLYNCKTKDVEAVTPFTYTFKGFDDVKLPTVTPTAPAAVSVTAASVTSSTAAAAVASGLSSIKPGEPVPAAVQKAIDDVNNAIPANKADKLANSFTPDVISNITKTGTMPADLQKDVESVTSNPALKAYLPTFTPATVDGQQVTGGRVGASNPAAQPVLPIALATNDDDACKAAANKAAQTVLDGLLASYNAQVAQIDAAYTQNTSGGTAAVTACKSDAQSSYNTQIAAATAVYQKSISDLDAAKATLGDKSYKTLSNLVNITYTQTIVAINNVLKSSQKACEDSATKKQKNAENARDNDKKKIKNDYDSAVQKVNNSLKQAVASCHNQGGGREAAEDK